MRNTLNIKDIFGKTITVLDTIPDDIEAPIHSLENCILRNVDLSFHNLEGCYMWSAYCEGGKFISCSIKICSLIPLNSRKVTIPEFSISAQIIKRKIRPT